MNDANATRDTLLGHPKGLFVLFFTELWERFSFYSMRGILTLYTAGVVLAAMGAEAGGRADAIYGAYLGFVYSSTFIGGMLADRLLGQRRAIYIGGTLMALAQFTLAGHALLVKGGTPVASLNWLFFLGLGLLSAGNGFFKPNISTIVGTLYQQGDGRRDAAFTIFYMGINIGAFLASFSAGIAQKYGWHLGFLLAGTGMILGQIIFALGRGTIEGKGLPPEGVSLRKAGRAGIPNGIALLRGNWRLHPAGRVPDFQPPVGAEPGVDYRRAGRALPAVGGDAGEPGGGGTDDRHPRAVHFLHDVLGLLRTGGQHHHAVYGRRGEPQHLRDGSAGGLSGQLREPAVDHRPEHSRRRDVGMAGPPAGGAVVALQVRAGPGVPVAGIRDAAARRKEAQASATGKCAMIWLILAFFFHTTGELCLSPVGLSTITKLSPVRLVGMFMGVWFLSSALGNVLAPWVAGAAAGGDFSDVFLRIALITAGGGAVLLLLVPLLKRMMHGVK